MLGHKADLAVMALDPGRLGRCGSLQTELVAAGLELVDSYLSITEVSEYAAGLPDEMKSDRLYPTLPPEAKNAWCFYPMSKRRGEASNWFTTDFDRRKELMYEHGTSGRKFAGRLVQLITGSTGLDDYEWGGHPLRPAPRRPERGGLHHALRRGVGCVRRVRPVLHRDGGATGRGGARRPRRSLTTGCHRVTIGKQLARNRPGLPTLVT